MCVCVCVCVCERRGDDFGRGVGFTSCMVSTNREVQLGVESADVVIKKAQLTLFLLPAGIYPMCVWGSHNKPLKASYPQHVATNRHGPSDTYSGSERHTEAMGKARAVFGFQYLRARMRIYV